MSAAPTTPGLFRSAFFEETPTATALGVVALELALLGLVLVKGRQVVRSFVRSRRGGRSLPVCLEDGIAAAVGRSWLAVAVAQELTIVYYAFSGPWRSCATSPLHDRDTSTWRAVVLGGTVLIAGEAFAVHVLLRFWSPLGALLVTGLHAYSLLWLVGDYHALRDNPHALTADGIRIMCGMRAALDVRRENVLAVELHDGPAPKERDYLRANALRSPNLIITLHTPATATLLFGRRKSCRRAGIAVERPAEVRAAILAHLAGA